MVTSEGGDCDEVMCARWGESGGEWTEWGWRNEEGTDIIGSSFMLCHRL